MTTWERHVDGKFKNYQQRWNFAYARWQTARALQDVAAMVDAFEEQGACLLAEQIAHADMAASVEHQRWNRDYLAEARARTPKGGTSTDRLRIVESIMATVPT